MHNLNNQLHTFNALFHPFAAFDLFLGFLVIEFITKRIKTEDVDTILAVKCVLEFV